MYLLKQWRESRIVSGLAFLALTLLLLLVIKGNLVVDSTSGTHQNDPSHFWMILTPLFYSEVALIAFWGWLAGGIGLGKNLGEDSGSFLLTRPRRRAWFLWNDWGFAVSQIAIIVVLTNLMCGFLFGRVLALIHSPGYVQVDDGYASVPLALMMTLIGVGAFLFAAFIYGLTYLCTVLLRRASGVMLSAGMLVTYAIARGVFHHYYPKVELPNLILDIFDKDHDSFYGLAGGMGFALVGHVILALLPPIAAQLILDRAEI